MLGLSHDNEFHSHANKINFHMQVGASGLVFLKRLNASQLMILMNNHFGNKIHSIQ